MVMTESIEAALEAAREELIATRRRLHREPELSFHETETAAFITARLRAIEGIESVSERVGGTGVTALLRGAHPGPILLLRADIDALPIQEATGAPYASIRDGVMHACGHDGHTAILLGVARALAAQRDRLHGSAFLVFQPAEEIGQGARAMIDAGLWDLAGDPVAATLGLHLANWLPVGTVGVRVGPTFAAGTKFAITIAGRGGHGAMPYLCADPLLTAAELAVSLQRIVSHEVSPLTPAVLSIGQLHAGTAPNIIPDEAWLAGTLRTYAPEVRDTILEKMERMAAGIAAAGATRHCLEIQGNLPAVVNDGVMCDLVRATATEVVGAAHVIEPDPVLASDDVAVFLEHAPGCYFLVGSCDPARGFDAPHHHPRFDIAEEVLVTAAQVFAGTALRYLAASHR